MTDKLFLRPPHLHRTPVTMPCEKKTTTATASLHYGESAQHLSDELRRGYHFVGEGVRLEGKRAVPLTLAEFVLDCPKCAAPEQSWGAKLTLRVYDANRPHEVIVNGYGHALGKTGDETWKELSIEVPLDQILQGKNTVQFQYAKGEPANWDNLLIDTILIEYYEDCRRAVDVSIGGLVTSDGSGRDDRSMARHARDSGAEVTRNVSTGSKLLQELRAACAEDGCIATLRIFAHGWRRGIVLRANNGLYDAPWDGTRADAATLADLHRAVAAGRLRFHKACTIMLVGCHTATGDFARELSRITGGVVYAAAGVCAPKRGNPGSFTVDGDGRGGGGWRKLNAGEEVANPEQADPRLGPRNRFGTNTLKVW